MKISVERCNAGTSIKCFIPKSEITNKYSDFIKDTTKDFRKQKTYKTYLSHAQEVLLEKIIYELMYNYKQYFSTYSCGEVGEKAIELKIQNVFSSKIDDYQKEALLNILSLAKSFVFNERCLSEIDTLKDKYGLNKEDLMIGIIGTYGYGKTTLIKKIFNFTDDFIFPLVDKGRTSINTCYFRGLIVKDNKIDNINITEYLFKNIITFKDFNIFFNDTIRMNLYSAFDIYFKARYTNSTSPELECLKKFIISDKANLDELFGPLGEYDSLDRDSFYNVIIGEFEQLYSSLPPSLINQLDTDNIDIPGEYKKQLLDNNTLINSFTTYIHKKINSTINSITATTKNSSIVYDASKNQLYFSITQDQIGEIDNYYNFFINNASCYKGRLLRLIVDEIYTELDLDSDILNISDDVRSSITSLVFVDTMGAGHNASKSEATNNLCTHITTAHCSS